LEELYKRYGHKAAFLNVYVREAHPTDGWRMLSNDRVGISLAQPQLMRERAEAAKQCCNRLHFTMPTVVDRLDDRVGNAYSGMPDRLYVIDQDGRVVYKSGRGPFGFKPHEMEQSLLMLLLDQEGAGHQRMSTSAPAKAQPTPCSVFSTRGVQKARQHGGS